MPEKVYIYLLILCVISYQGITGAFLNEDTGKLSNVLVREKRVISRNSNEDVPVASEAFPFIVNFKINNRIIGVGSILSPRTVITAAGIMNFETSQYVVTSASTYTFLGVLHNVTDRVIKFSRPNRRNTGIALVYVNPPMEHRKSKSIGLHTGPVLPGVEGTVIGWSSSLHGGRQESSYPRRLRAITVPIISHRECVNIYRGIFEIRDDNICTYHQQKQCGQTDVGAPLIIDNELAGIHIGIIHTCTVPIKPDVFVLQQHADYNQWIRSHIIH